MGQLFLFPFGWYVGCLTRDIVILQNLVLKFLPRLGIDLSVILPTKSHVLQVHILSYQCSALTDAKGIENIFTQCAQLQSNQDIKSYTAVVVLDEIGLAEDSPNMPLKVYYLCELFSWYPI